MKLEIGPGFAERVKKEFKEHVFKPKVTGDDVVYLDVNISKIRIVNFVVGDAHYLPFTDRCFEEVYASHLIEHLSDPMKFFRESYRVLHDAGQLYLWLPNFVTKGATENPTDKNVYNFVRLKREREKAEFKCYERRRKLPLVSIIVPVYNSEDTIEVCLRTLIKQTYPMKEIIVVDDGSTDNTVEVLSKMVREHSRFRMISIGHGGPAKARNTGLKFAKGDVVFFGEGDAIYQRDYLRKAMELFEADSRIGGVCLTGAPWIVKPTFITECIDVENKIQRKLLASGTMQAFYAWVFRKEAIEVVGGFDERLFQGEDRDLFLRVKKEGYSIGLITGINWRHRRNQTLLDFTKRTYLGSKTRILYLLKHYKMLELIRSISLLWFVILALPLVLFFPLLIYVILFSLFLPIIKKLVFVVRFGWDGVNRKRYLFLIPLLSPLRYMISAVGYTHGLLIVFFRKLRGKTVDWSSMR